MTTPNRGATMSDTPRIPLVESGALVATMNWFTRRTYGAVMEPALGLAHNRRVLLSSMRFQRATEHWDAADDSLKHLATLATAATVGCSWCLDFGFWVSYAKGVDRAKLEAITAWRTSDVYTDHERRVIAYAEAMSTTPLTVTDEMVAGLREDLGDAALVELTAVIALENSYSRMNAALGFTSQGFRDQCDLRPAHA
jgi:AhpD family alkylhydroperoxidase